jgi:hypothetical protein
MMAGLLAIEKKLAKRALSFRIVPFVIEIIRRHFQALAPSRVKGGFDPFPYANSVKEAMMKTLRIHAYQLKPYFIVFLICIFGLSLSQTAGAAETTLRSPECSEIQEWVATIDLSDQYQPLESAPYDKLPTAYGSEAFTVLFGKPALEWTQGELRQMYDHILSCGKNAGKDYRKKVRPLSRNLRNILTIQDQKTRKN